MYNEEVTVSSKYLESLKDAKIKLDFLEQYGVEDWEFYNDALAIYHKRKEKESAIETFLEGLQDIIGGSKVEQMSERGAGFSVYYDEDMVLSLLEILLERVA